MKSTKDIALEFLQNGKFYESIALFSTLIDNSKADSTLLYYRSVAYRNTGDLESAIEDLNEAIEIKSDSAIYFQNRGGIEYELGKFEDALFDFNNCLNLNPNDLDCLLLRSLTLAAMGELNKSLLDAKKLIDLNPLNHLHHAQKAYCLTQLQQFEDAIKSYDAAIEQFDKQITYFNDRGFAKNNLYIKTGNVHLLDDAINDFNEALKLDNKFSDSLERRGYSKYLKALYLYNNGMAYDFTFNNEKMGINIENAIVPILNDALADLFESIKLNNQSAYGNYKISLCYNMTNQYEEAMRYINNALSIQPKNDDFISLKIQLLEVENKNLKRTIGKLKLKPDFD